MNKKHQKSVLILMLSAMLSTTACSDSNGNVNYRENAYENVEDIMNDTNFYQEKHAGSTNEEFYSPFYANYLNHFINYMDEEQYSLFLEMVSKVDDQERYEFPTIYSYLTSIMGTEKSFGHGFYYAFNTRLIFESLFSAYFLRDDTFTHINTLRDIINNDEVFYQSLFSKDINALIDCIMENTSFSNRSLVEEMILKFDIYVDKSTSTFYMDQKLKEEAANRIQEIMNKIVASKCANDPEFAKTFYARMIQNSRYFDDETFELTRCLIEDTFNLVQNDEQGYLIITLPNDYYFSNKSLEEVKEAKFEDVVFKEIKEEKRNMLSLLSLLVTEETLQKMGDASPDAMRQYIYEDLSSFFSSEDDFNDFCLRLYNGTSYSLEKYFNIFKSRIKEDDITLLDFIRYYSLVELNKEHTFNHYDFYDSKNTMTYDELRKLKEEEYQNIAYNYPENYFLSNIDYSKEFDLIENILSQNDLGFQKIYSSNKVIDWYIGEIDENQITETVVLSELVEPHNIDYEGNKFVYYECPKGFEHGRAVDAFLNIDKELTIREQTGFTSEVINPETGEIMFIYLVGLNEDIDTYPSLRFITEYSHILNQEKDQKKLIYEVDHE